MDSKGALSIPPTMGAAMHCCYDRFVRWSRDGTGSALPTGNLLSIAVDHP